MPEIPQPNGLRFLEASADPDQADILIVGFPFDGTTSFRAGTRFGPNALREASWVLENYSPYLDRSLEDLKYADVGDLDLPVTGSERVCQMIYRYCSEQIQAGKKIAGIGGEHSVSYGLIKAYWEKYPDLHVVHFDAHADLREDYDGERWSHASVIRRVLDFLSSERLKQYGIRSGTREEFIWMREKGTLVEDRMDLISTVRPPPGTGFYHLRPGLLRPGLFPGHRYTRTCRRISPRDIFDFQ